MLTFSQFKKRVISEALSDDEKSKVDTWEKGDNSFSDHVFGDSQSQRKSVELEHPERKSEHHSKVEEHLAKHGFSVADYKSGKAKDKYGREVNIGKALEKTKAPDEIKKGFANDPSRQQQKKTSGSDLHVCLSRHPHDVAGMTSSGHSWENESCMNFKSGSNRRYLQQDVKHGTHIAYLTHKDDHDNSHPLARIALKKFTNIDDPHDHILRPEDRTYGNAPDAFHHTVHKLLNHHFPGKEDAIYKKHDDVYDDSGNRYVIGKNAVHKAMTHHDYDVRNAAYHQHPEEVKKYLHKALDSKDFNVKYDAITHEHATPEHIHKALDDGDEDIKIAAIQHHNASPENINKALNDNNYRIRRLAAQHPNASPENIHKALDDDDDEVRFHAARHTNASHENIHKALDDDDSKIRISAAGNPSATKEHLHKALDDKDVGVRTTAAGNWNFESNGGHLSKALDDKDVGVRREAVQNYRANSEHLHKALNDSEPGIRALALMNHNSNMDHVERGLKDSHDLVRDIAKARKAELERKKR